MSSANPVEPSWEAYEEARPIVVPTVLKSPHPITRRTAAVRGWELEPRWTDPKPDWQDSFDVSVHEANRARALLLIDAFLKACSERDFGLRHDAKGSHFGISIFVDAEPIPMRLVERGAVVTYLSLETGREYGKRVWKDSPRRPLEKRLNEIMIGLRKIVAVRLARRREWEDYQRGQAELLRKRVELREQVEREQEAVDELIDEAKAWQQAKTIRAYTAAVKALAKSQGTLADHTEWIDWAFNQADRLDPLCVSPPSVLDTPRDQYRELHLHEFLGEDGNIEDV